MVRVFPGSVGASTRSDDLRTRWIRRDSRMTDRVAFQIVALPSESFAHLFDLTDEELRARGARRMVVDEKPGFPCRVSLEDGEVGETVVLIPFTHHDVASPYRASGPVFVRQGVRTARPVVDEIPVMLQHRLLSIRAYDVDGMMVGADVVPGSELPDTIGRVFAAPAARYLHIHNARPRCFSGRVERAGQDRP